MTTPPRRELLRRLPLGAAAVGGTDRPRVRGGFSVQLLHTPEPA